jgi:methyl-accepting chemotaxis protein-1 (serine sensor receptor)
MRTISIKGRLIVTVGVLSLLLIAIGITALIALKTENERLRTVYEDRLVPLNQVSTIDRLILRNRLLIAVSLVTPEPKYIADNMDRLDKNIATISKLWDEFMNTYLTPEEKELAAKFAESRKRFVNEGLKPAAAALRDGNLDGARKIVADKVQPLYEPVIEGIEALIKLQIDVAKQEYEEAVNEYRMFRLASVIAVLAGLAIAGVMGWLLIQAIMRPLNAAVTLAGRVAKGELDNSITIERDDELGKLTAALKEMNARLVEIVSEVHQSSEAVGSAAGQIASGNEDLSQRTQEQASALQETAASMEEMTSTVKQNAENARQANQLAVGARDQAEKGSAIVTQAVAAMSEINNSSNKIAEIIGVIDGIAFQTNLLSLNAAVEAARAGEQGRGFAVVAAEVRNLAQRSAAAAKEIKSLINDSVEKVNAGSELVAQCGKALSDILDSVKKVTDTVAEITAASQEQSSGIEQVNTAVVQLDQVTQQNAALVEEAAAAAKSMEEQARRMRELMDFFKLGANTLSFSSTPSPLQENRAPLKEHRVTDTGVRRHRHKEQRPAALPAMA